ncbi:hypothetical protein DL762_001873 [Monosporascus cannonballus]|uniref:FAD-binding domain-containing protein n=1 Tax=Monosporascus cannonballus TaxID=155416 RepID=A0ABY0HF82_9PEZI|nr:hypothetical protein DL763_008971 [Monosporascus cannonballus]RYO92044.1 hypothetical protein DL762_001873 [Monosporascus cannonballus]
MPDSKLFKVIIAGGSVVGLTLANILEQAKIEFILLEKREIAPDLGAAIAIQFHTSKVLEQLGIFQVIKDAAIPLLRRWHYDEKGHLFEKNDYPKILTERTGRPFVFIQRRFYLESLFNNIKDKSKIRAHSGLHSYVETGDGVVVTTEAGEKIEGSVLIGADGVHSTVRQLMAESLANDDPKRADTIVRANYRAVVGTSTNHFLNEPSRRFLDDAVTNNVYYRGASGLVTCAVKGIVFWTLVVKEDGRTVAPNCPRYSESDRDETMKRYGNLAGGPGYTFADLYRARKTAWMVPMEEGVVSDWSLGGRVLLVGDAAFKATINLGFGGNTASEGIYRLANELVPLLERSPNPSTSEIVDVFAKYEQAMRPRAEECVTLSHYGTRLEAMDTWWLRIIGSIIPWIPESFKANFLMSYMRPSPCLVFLPDPDKTDQDRKMTFELNG